MLDVFFFLAGNPCKTKLKTFVLIPVSGLPVYCIINTVIKGINGENRCLPINYWKTKTPKSTKSRQTKFLYNFNCILTTVYFISFTMCLLTSATPKSEIFSVPSVAKSKFPGLICRYCQGNQSLQIITVPAKF